MKYLITFLLACLLPLTTQANSDPLMQLVRAQQQKQKKQSKIPPPKTATKPAIKNVPLGTDKSVRYIRTHNSKIKEATAQRIAQAIKKESARTGIPENVLLAIAHKESTFYPNAKSNKGAYGVMQVRRSVHTERMRRLNATDLNNIEQNVKVGANILQEYLQRSNGNMHKALTRYSGGSSSYANRVLKTAYNVRAI